jgi:uncharacterized protein
MTTSLDHKAKAHTAKYLAGRDNPALLKLVAAIRAAYGPRLERIVLFGSRARGDHEADSDFDVAVFLHGIRDFNSRMAEIDRIREIERSLVGPDDPLFELVVRPAGAWTAEIEFMENLNREGIDL